MARRDEAPVGQVPEAIMILFDRYEANGKMVLRMLSEEERIPAVRRITDAGRAYHRDWATRTFRPLLRGLRGRARERRLTAIVIATDLLVWKLLRHDMQLDRPTAEQIVTEMVLGQRLTGAHTAIEQRSGRHLEVVIRPDWHESWREQPGNGSTKPNLKVLKTVDGGNVVRGFESPPFRVSIHSCVWPATPQRPALVPQPYALPSAKRSRPSSGIGSHGAA